MSRILRTSIDTALSFIPMSLIMVPIALIVLAIIAGCTAKKITVVDEIPQPKAEIVERVAPVIPPSPATPPMQEQAPALPPPIRLYFDFDSYALSNVAKDQISYYTASVEAMRGLCWSITGSACPIGTGDYNWQLGLKRAEAVAQYLRDEYGIAECVQCFSIGESQAGTLEEADYWKARFAEIEVK